jgi:GalNAc-alpha-(1->4)-GalNAc-alpha-(1->3)-diNAcBac-PP-undecaprenol alpha-1,4-N-acetyl-D-galactosaminyltransferase
MPMRITLVISTFAAGGAERVMSSMANYWAERGEDVTLITLSSQSKDWYTLDPRIKRVGLGVLSISTHIGQAIRHNVRRIIWLRRALRRARPDIVISFLDTTNVLTLMANWGFGIPVIVSERIDPHQDPIGLAWSGLRSLLYRHADAVVVQSCVVRDWALRLQGIKAIYVIPNPVNPIRNGSEHTSSRHGSSHIIVAMGRLVRQKGFDILIEAFGRCAAKHSNWSLVILGEGPERASLQTIAAGLGIADRVSLAGQCQEPATILKGADLFVLSSRYEGFPNALLEAMACKLAVISTDCPSGPRDIIRNGVDGVLVPSNDVTALADAMDRLMANSDERRRLGTGALEVIERFSMERIMTMWDEAVIHACQAANH